MGKNTTIILITILLLSGCGKTEKNDNSSNSDTGTITFVANGEDFVRKGFLDKKGWKISFDHLYVNIADVWAYKPDGKGETLPGGARFVDLAAGDENSAPINVGKIDNIPPGNYQSLKFSLKRAESGKFTGYSIVMIGKAEKKINLLL